MQTPIKKSVQFSNSIGVLDKRQTARTYRYRAQTPYKHSPSASPCKPKIARRAALSKANELTSNLFDGGALDSQVSETQFMYNLTGSFGEVSDAEEEDDRSSSPGCGGYNQLAVLPEAFDGGLNTSDELEFNPLERNYAASPVPSVACASHPSAPLEMGELSRTEERVVAAMREAQDTVITDLQQVIDDAFSAINVMRDEVRELEGWKAALTEQMKKRGIDVSTFSGTDIV